MRLTIRFNDALILDGEVVTGPDLRPALRESDGNPRLLDLSHVFGCCLGGREVDPLRRGETAEVLVHAGHTRQFQARREDDRIVMTSGEEEYDLEEASFLEVLDVEQLSEVTRAALLAVC